MTEELKAEVFDYLNDLRESGINMFGAASYIFDLSTQESENG